MKDFDKRMEFRYTGQVVPFSWDIEIGGVLYNVLKIWLEGLSPGGGGPGFSGIQLGGAGGSGCFAEGMVGRPASGLDHLYVGRGGQGYPANYHQWGANGETSWFGDAENGRINLYGGGGGYPPLGDPASAGEGGTPGVMTEATRWIPGTAFTIPGGMGQASVPCIGGVNPMLPMGASAPRGGRGACNNQSAQLGGGGAPGNVENPSGSGGDGLWIAYIKIGPGWAVPALT